MPLLTQIGPSLRFECKSTLARVIRADLHLLDDRTPGPPGTPACVAPAAPPHEADLDEKPGKAGVSSAGGGAVLGAGEREGGEGDPPLLRRRRGSRCSTPVSAPSRPPPGRCASASPSTSAAASGKILRVNADAARRCVTFASRLATRSGPRRTSCRCGAMAPGRPPSLDPSRIFDVAARLDLAVDPDGLALSLKACAGEGDPVSAAAKAATLAFSAVPDAPTAPSRNFFALGVRHGPRHSAALAAAPFR